MRYARMDNGTAAGTVVETYEPPEGFTIDNCFHPDVVALFHECPSDVQVGWEADGEGAWNPPAP